MCLKQRVCCRVLFLFWLLKRYYEDAFWYKILESNTVFLSMEPSYIVLWGNFRFAFLIVQTTENWQVTQESPPAWTQEAYRPPCSEYSFCCPTRVPPPGGYRTWVPPPGGYPDLGTPPMDRQTPVKTVPSRRTTYAGGNEVSVPLHSNC